LILYQALELNQSSWSSQQGGEQKLSSYAKTHLFGYFTTNALNPCFKETGSFDAPDKDLSACNRENRYNIKYK